MPASQTLHLSKAAGPTVVHPVFSAPAGVSQFAEEDFENALGLSTEIEDDHIEDDTKKPGAASASEKVGSNVLKAKRNRTSTHRAIAIAKYVSNGPSFSITNKYAELQTGGKDDDDDC